jgi:HlyD family secretion protein
MLFRTEMGKRCSTVTAVVAIVLALGAGCHKSQAGKYRTVKVDRGDITMSVSATGTLSAVKTVQVGSQVSGIIAKLYADFNSRVAKDQQLAELDPTPFQQTIEQRRADLLKAQVDAGNAQTTFVREEKLQKEGLASQAEFDNARAAAESARAQVSQARAALAQAETSLRNSKIVSPIDGIVVNRAYDVGQTVAASFQAPTLFTIAQDLTKMQVQADVDESDIGRVKADQPAHFTVDAFPDRQFTAKVSQIRLNATVTQNVVTYPVIIEVANPDEKLRPSMTANVSIDVATVSDVLRIPNAALRFRPEGEVGPGGASGPSGPSGESAGPRPGLAGAVPRRTRGAGPTVYVLDASGKLNARKVQIGVSDGRFTEVKGGEIALGDSVATGTATAKSDQSGTAPRMRF